MRLLPFHSQVYMDRIQIFRSSTLKEYDRTAINIYRHFVYKSYYSDQEIVYMDWQRVELKGALKRYKYVARTILTSAYIPFTRKIHVL